MFYLGRFADALADLEHALELTPDDLSTVVWIPVDEVAACPDEAFRKGVLALANRGVALNDRAGRSLTARAHVLVAFGEWERAREDLDAVVAAEDATHYASYEAALLSVVGDDTSRYGKLCLKMLAAFADSDVAIETHLTAWTCALAASAIEDYTPAIKLARHAVEKEPLNQQYLNGLGAILMRAGQYDEAKVALEKALEATGATGTSPGYTRYFLAMTEHHLGAKQAARKHLQTANISADEEIAGTPSWNRKLTLGLLRKEADTLIGKPNEASAATVESPTESTSAPE